LEGGECQAVARRPTGADLVTLSVKLEFVKDPNGLNLELVGSADPNL
jgi:hypothetical protein